MRNDSIKDIIAKATEGLVLISETDSAMEPVAWDDANEINENQVILRTDSAEGTPVETTTLDDFFRMIPNEDRMQFDHLKKVLQEHLSEIRVYKVGESEKKVLIIGRTKDNIWAGVSTLVVET